MYQSGELAEAVGASAPQGGGEAPGASSADEAPPLQIENRLQ
jgi:hypothetical protein